MRSLIDFVEMFPEVEDISIRLVDDSRQAITLEITPTELIATQIKRFYIIKGFFKSRANKYKKIRIHRLGRSLFEFFDPLFILKEAAQTLEKLETDIDFANVDENLVLSKVKRLVWYGPTLSSETILAIREKLPNLEEARVITSRNGKEANTICSDFEKAFPDLKKFDYQFKRNPGFD